MHPYARKGFIFLLSLIAASSHAQTGPIDSTADPVYKMYMTSVGGASNLFNGTEYTAYYPSTRGTPFWDTAGFKTGTLSYGGVVYKDIPIAYDLVSNEVLIRGYRQLVIKLDPARIDFFRVAGHLFVKFNGDANSRNLIPVDIYDMVYNGATKVYVKRRKQVARNIGEDGRYPFLTYNAFFVYKDGMYHDVSKRNDLLAIFKDKSDAIKTFWKQEKLNFKTGAERMIAETAAYYDRIKNER
ncbi:MAG TPA: hypothetical protein VD993_01010 [Chitinophagaceae bacterium]|nr:hypothetical protein [Chitinophagaceae bacterium]